MRRRRQENQTALSDFLALNLICRKADLGKISLGVNRTSPPRLESGKPLPELKTRSQRHLGRHFDLAGVDLLIIL